VIKETWLTFAAWLSTYDSHTPVVAASLV
jgi:hypothetical protein